MVLEGTILGIVASAVGLGLGVLLAKGLTTLFRAVDLEMPQTAMVFQLRTAVVAMLTGTIVTLVASVWPAVRATRVSPISAVREGGMVVKKPSRKTLVFGLAVTSLSAFGLVYGLLGENVSSAVRVLGIGLGSFGIFIGLAAIAPRLVRPLAHVVGLPAARLGGVAGRLAQENAVRNPGRTASTAAALMIGLTLVSFVAVFGKALLTSDENALRKQLGTSHVITSQSGWDAVPLGAGKAASTATGVRLASSIRGDRAQLLGGGEVDVSGVDPGTIGPRLQLRVGRGLIQARLPSWSAAARSFARAWSFRVPGRLRSATGSSSSRPQARKWRRSYAASTEARRPRPAAGSGRVVAAGRSTGRSRGPATC